MEFQHTQASVDHRLESDGQCCLASKSMVALDGSDVVVQF